MQTITFDTLRESLRKQITEWVFDYVCNKNIDQSLAERLIEMHHELEHCDDDQLIGVAKFLTTLGVKIYNPNVLAVNANILRVR